MDWLKDERTNSWSCMTQMPISDYLKLAELPHSDSGGIKGQREALSTTTAKRIRKRLVEDLILGAVPPPIVIGIVADKILSEKLPLKESEGKLVDQLSKDNLDTIAIIDGMQRTTALLEAIEKKPSIGKGTVRVEFWIAENVHNLIYRMIVLNTGQVPWTMARQLSVMFKPLLIEIGKEVPEVERIFSPEHIGRRVRPGEYSSEVLIEMYMSFSTRKLKVDTKQMVSEEFSKLDFVENLSTYKFERLFYRTLNILAQLDKILARYETADYEGRFSNGRNLFDGHPARVGFTVAFAQHVIGRPGIHREEQEQEARMVKIESDFSDFAKHLASLNVNSLGDYLKLDVLKQITNQRSGKVGEFERELFQKAFTVLIDEEFKLDNLEPCWRAL